VKSYRFCSDLTQSLLIYVSMFFKLCWLWYGDSKYCSRKEVETAVAY